MSALTAYAASAAFVILCITPAAAQLQKYPATGEGSSRPLSVVDCIEMTKVLRDFPQEPILVSPDGNRYLAILYRGDVARNGSWVELLSGSTTSLEAASRPSMAVRLFSKSTAEVTDLIKNVRWLEDSEHVTFLWDDGSGSSQVMLVDLQTHETRRLTRHPTVIVRYDISRNGENIIYMARAARNNQSHVTDMMRRGFAITQQDLWSILRGDVDGWRPALHYDTYVSSTGQKEAHKISEMPKSWYTRPYLLTVSPNGQYAVAEEPATDIPADWDKYTEHIFKEVYLPPARKHPGSPNAVRQYYLINIRQAVDRKLWDAPVNPYGNVVWAPDSRSLIIGPTFLPVKEADPTGLAGLAVAQIEVSTGKYAQLRLPTDLSPYGYRPLSWDADGIVEFTGTENHRLTFKKTPAKWEPITQREDKKKRAARVVRIEVRQDLNTPPAIYAVDPERGLERLIRDLNPQLRTRVTLGRVELVHWAGTDGRPWTGVLYYPVHFSPTRRFPLVIQTHGYSATEFSPEGSFTTVFAAQPLANRDIAVLQLGAPDSGMEGVTATPLEPKVFMAGYEGAVAEFSKAGLVDHNKVGIIGFSRTGWQVEYALTHSQFRFAAAVVADNMDAGYVNHVLSEYSTPSEDEADNGAIPIGKGLEQWLQTAPGFNTDKVRTPLRMEIDSGPLRGSVLGVWEVFNNLRYLGKPVEVFVIPDIEHGVHVLQNPAQRVASEGGTVDWFCFWLKGEEDPHPEKSEQYVRWRALAALREQSTDTVYRNP